ncbi:MAG: GerMN domain-containing protein [Lachnospiraceae bacterium]|nr:GerMN domain-containing protein [Lachnospiraceae bacterium]
MKSDKLCGYNFISKVVVMLCFAVLFVCLFGCGSKEEEGTPVVMSYISSQSTKIIEKTAYLVGEDSEEQLKEVLNLLATPSSKLEYHVPLAQGITVLTTNLTNQSLVLNLSAEYKQLNPTMEILTRASLVKSLTQVKGIDKVTIHIDGEPLRDSLEKPIGAMSAEMFIDNAGEEISTYDKVTVRLYFANEAGDALVAVDRSKAYNTNISLDKFVVEELLKGPETQGVYPTINPETKLISTLVKDNTCYVNFDSTFLKQVYEVKAEIAIYSIVNSLCELSGIDRVQIFVDGKSEVMFREMIPLTTVFSRDLDYIQQHSD